MVAQEAASLGVWDRDMSTNEIVMSGANKKLYGLASDDPPLTYDRWLALVHPEDRERIRELVLRETAEQMQVLDGEYRVVWPDGSVHWILAKGTLFHDDFGRAVRATGVNLDITDRKHAESALRESEERFRNMADTAPVMIWIAGLDKLCTYFNKCWLDFTGHSLDQKIGEGWIAGVHPEDREQFLSVFSSSIDARQMFRWFSGCGGQMGSTDGCCVPVFRFCARHFRRLYRLLRGHK